MHTCSLERFLIVTSMTVTLVNEPSGNVRAVHSQRVRVSLPDGPADGHSPVTRRLVLLPSTSDAGRRRVRHQSRIAGLRPKANAVLGAGWPSADAHWRPLFWGAYYRRPGTHPSLLLFPHDLVRYIYQ